MQKASRSPACIISQAIIYCIIHAAWFPCNRTANNDQFSKNLLFSRPPDFQQSILSPFERHGKKFASVLLKQSRHAVSIDESPSNREARDARRSLINDSQRGN